MTGRADAAPTAGVTVRAMEDAGRRGALGGAEGDSLRWTSGWRRGVLAAGMFVYPAVTAVGVAQYSHGVAAVAGYSIVFAFCCCYALAAYSFARGSRSRM